MNAETAGLSLTRALEDYLETILLLLRENPFARVRDIARARDVRAAPVAPAPQRRREPRPKRQPGTARKTKIKQKEKRQAISLPKPKLSILKRRSEPVEENGVKVTGAAEERCPYCLDVVEKKDARGVVVCEICDSPHHADCWEAGGGMCQVPHLIT